VRHCVKKINASTALINMRNISAQHVTDLPIESIRDKREMYRVNRLYAFLHNVIAVLILDTLQHVALQLLRYLHLKTVK